MNRRSAIAAAIVAVLAAGTAVGVWLSLPSGTPPQNVLLVLTDDQRWDSLQYMPNVQSLLVQQGVTFSNAFLSNPLCCPARSSVFTGLTSGHNGVWGNTSDGGTGGFDAFTANGDDQRQMFGWMHDSGYQTMFTGKFLNGYSGPGGSGNNDIHWILPGIDEWDPFLLNPVAGYTGPCQTDGYNATCYSHNGVYQGEDATTYSTATSATKVKDFIAAADPGSPVFVEWAPRAPHYPSTPATQYQTSCGTIPSVSNTTLHPAWNKTIVDAPAYMTGLPSSDASNLNTRWKNSCRSLLSVDNQLSKIIDVLTSTGRLADTVIIFASDNGFLFGEHRWVGKVVPYEESIREPIVVRADALIPSDLRGTTDMTFGPSDLDIAPTVLDAAGVSRTGLDGQSILPLVEGSGGWTPVDAVLLEHAGGAADGDNAQNSVPPYCGVRGPTYMYAQYATGEEELYDLNADPNELTNVASDPGYATLLDMARSQAHALCDPTPPGFSWSH